MIAFTSRRIVIRDLQLLTKLLDQVIEKKLTTKHHAPKYNKFQVEECQYELQNSSLTLPKVFLAMVMIEGMLTILIMLPIYPLAIRHRTLSIAWWKESQYITIDLPTLQILPGDSRFIYLLPLPRHLIYSPDFTTVLEFLLIHLGFSKIVTVDM